MLTIEIDEQRLRELVEQVAELRQRVSALEREPHRGRKPPERRHGSFLSGVVRSVGACVFESEEVFRLAAVNEALRAHLQEHGITTTVPLGARQRTIRKLGKVAAYLVVACGRGNRGQRWVIELAARS